jgi:hypothetical protein
MEASMKPKILKPFHHKGRVVHPGDTIEVDETHHGQLARNGLVAPAKGDASPADKPTPGVVKTPTRVRVRKPLV